MYIKAVDDQIIKFPYNLGELKKDNPNTSFPDILNDDVLAAYDTYSVVETPAPQIDTRTHRLTQAVSLIDGKWTQQWSIQKLAESQASTNIRAARNQLLTGSDWTQLPDAPSAPETWSIYRQALRDITEQANFPWDVTWPEAP